MCVKKSRTYGSSHYRPAIVCSHATMDAFLCVAADVHNRCSLAAAVEQMNLASCWSGVRECMGLRSHELAQATYHAPGRDKDIVQVG
jgi:hypothetical protein